MSGERFVILGLGTSRSPWFSEVARWATVGSIPADFVKCIAPEEMRVRLASARAFSALLIDATTGAVDRDLIALAHQREVAVIVVDDSIESSWVSLGAAGVLPSKLTRQQLVETLVEVAKQISVANDLPADGSAPVDRLPGRQAPLVAVTGAGGVGTSTVAMALAQAACDIQLGQVLLADLCLKADLAMLHDARDVVPGLQEMVEAHRSAQPLAQEIQALTFDVVNRNYNLLLGLRRPRDWTALRRRSFESTLTGLRSAFGFVVADIENDFEGEAESGSIDIEERNLMARTVASQAGVMVLVGLGGVKGMHDLVRTANELRELGVDANSTIAVINRSARNPRQRGELTKTFAELTGQSGTATGVVGPIFLSERRGLDEQLRAGAKLPQQLVEPLGKAITAMLRRVPAVAQVEEPEPLPIKPGSLGAWPDVEIAG